jgi:2Fe-2S ferredoxin
MALIVIQNLEEKTIQVQDFSKTLLRHLQDHRTDWMQACGGKGRCTTCTVQILRGSENLEPKTKAENNYERQGLLQVNERLACQVKIKGDVLVAVPDQYKLPHVRYSS